MLLILIILRSKVFLRRILKSCLLILIIIFGETHIINLLIRKWGIQNLIRLPWLNLILPWTRLLLKREKFILIITKIWIFLIILLLIRISITSKSCLTSIF